MSSKKVYQNAHEAMQGILRDGLIILSGGFGICGIAENITEEIKNSKVKDLTVVSNNCGIDGYGLGTLLQTRQIKKMISSYVGENKTFEEQYLNGDLELEFSPQGTLAERCRAGGAGIPAFYTKTGVGTVIAEGKETKVIDGVEYLMEKAIKGDLSIIIPDTLSVLHSGPFNLSLFGLNGINGSLSVIIIYLNFIVKF